MKGVNASFTHDQETGNPIFVRADYPGLKPEDVAIPMLNTTKDIIGDEMETAVFDKWFSIFTCAAEKPKSAITLNIPIKAIPKPITPTAIGAKSAHKRAITTNHKYQRFISHAL